jgi:hypothetical protein
MGAHADGGPGALDDLRLGHLTQEWLATSEDPEARTSSGYWYHQRRIEPHAAVHTGASRTNCSMISLASPPRLSSDICRVPVSSALGTTTRALDARAALDPFLPRSVRLPRPEADEK